MVLLGNISDHRNTAMYPMKEVSLDELEEKETQDKQNKPRNANEEALAWEFDTDLVA
jgi:hypothetical protein